MMVVVVYDIRIGGKNAAKRARQIHAACKNWGVAVQDSVFECRINAEQYRRMKAELQELMDETCDTIRFYLLGNRYLGRIERIGCGTDKDLFTEGVL